jgi:hypothetical protein
MHLRALNEDTYMADVDIGEIFLYFVLHRELQSLTGVDLTHCFDSEDKDGRATKIWETSWQRAAMGLQSSPHQAVQAMGVAEEVIRGDQGNPANVFHWDRMSLKKPWVSKMRLEDEQITADLFTIIDDQHPTGPSRKEC